MKKWMLVFGLLQGADAASTLVGTHLLHFQELNPAMGSALAASPLVFLLLKGLGTLLFLAFVYRHRQRAAAVNALKAVTTVMGLVVSWNLAGIGLYVLA